MDRRDACQALGSLMIPWANSCCFGGQDILTSLAEGFFVFFFSLCGSYLLKRKILNLLLEDMNTPWGLAREDGGIIALNVPRLSCNLSAFSTTFFAAFCIIDQGHSSSVSPDTISFL